MEKWEGSGVGSDALGRPRARRVKSRNVYYMIENKYQVEADTYGFLFFFLLLFPMKKRFDRNDEWVSIYSQEGGIMYLLLVCLSYYVDVRRKRGSVFIKTLQTCRW